MNEKQYDLILLRTPDSRWWGLENEVLWGYFRWTSSRSDFRVINQNIKSLDIWIECHPTRCGDVIVKQNGKELVKYTPTPGKGNVIHLDITSYEDFSIYSNVFVPRDVDSSQDPRSLGIMVRAFVANASTEPCMSEMDEIPVRYESPIMSKIQKKFSEGLLTEFADYSPKPFNISTPLKHGAVLYLDKPYPRLMQQLKDYKASKSCEIVSYTDNPAVEADVHIDPLYSEWKRKYEYANLAGQKGIELAKSKGWDYFMWLEWDCYLGKDYWFDILWDEMLAWPHKPLQAGTPSIASQTLVGNMEFLKQDYIASYIRANRVCCHLVANRPFFLSINAALGFYETNEAHELLIEMPVPPLNSFDVLFGTRLFEKYGEDVFKHTAWLPSLYSGWGEQDYTEEQRVQMVTSGLKVAMHQYKKNDLPL